MYLRRLSAAGLALSILAACQTFQPLEPTDPTSPRLGSTVRVDLADAERRSTAAWRVTDAERLEGRVVRAGPDTLVLSVASRIDGRQDSRFRDTLAVPRALITGMEQQQLSVARSAALTAGLVVGTFLLLQLELTSGGQGPTGPGNGGTEAIVPALPVP